ncbi:MAG TPA: MBL fold metallo-hydrolase [Blastocatellia bacterium]|nr:MBL fold metallo-hydrolase [Blastocatellia bacterium]
MLKRILLTLALALVVALALLAYTFTPAKIDVNAYAEAANFALDATRPGPQPQVMLSLIKCGKMMSNKLFIYRGGSLSEDYDSGMAAVLVRHPQATILLDTGFGTNVDEHFKTIPFLMRNLTTYDKEQSAAAQLQQHGVTPNQINRIIISHSHWDHVSGLEDFPGVEVWMDRREVEYVRNLDRRELAREMIDKINLRPFDLEARRYENFDASLDLFGDGSVVLVGLPGHTPGSVGMFVNLASGKRYFFIGDLTWAAEGVQLPAERPWISRKLVDRDEEQVRRSIVKAHQLARKYPEMMIVPAHDRRVHDRIAAFPEVER